MDQNSDSVDHEAIIAEFAALRAEILQRSNLQWNIFALQLTASGVVFSFALSNSTHIAILLILPVISYALTGRYVSQAFGTDRIATYIREVLEVKMNGELHWETWQRIQPLQSRALGWLSPLFLVFPGVAVIALASVAPYVWASSNTSASKRALIIIIWLVGVFVTVLSFQLTARRAFKRKARRAFKRRIWNVQRRLGDNSPAASHDADPTAGQISTHGSANKALSLIHI